MTFWAGLLVIAFIGGAWRDSARSWQGISYGSWSLRHQACGVSLDRLSVGGEKMWHFSHGEMESFGAPLNEWRLAMPFFIHEGRMDPARPPNPYIIGARGEAMLSESPVWYLRLGIWSLFVPHWVMLAAAIMVWVGLLMWRRGMNRQDLT